MTSPAIVVPAANALRVGISVMGSTVAAEVTGASAIAVSASTVLVAAGAAVAIGLAGYGLYRWLASD